MKCETVNMLDLIKGRKDEEPFRMIVPFYQRRYCWTEENCGRLLDDLKGLVSGSEKSHFFGSVVYYPEEHDGGYNKRHIVDGQQRIVTVMLLLLAIRDLLGDCSVAVPGIGVLCSNDIKKNYFQSNLSDNGLKVKLQKGDEDAFESLYYNGTGPESRLVRNYRFFRNVLNDGKTDFGELFDAVGRLDVVVISLAPDDDPQLVFESLNSTGMALTEGEKVCNYIFMRVPEDNQRDLYNQYWVNVENDTDVDVSRFVRDYLSVKTGRISKEREVYRDYRRYAETLHGSGTSQKAFSENLLKGLVEYAGYYGICLGKEKSRMGRCLRRIRRLGVGVTRPFLMKVLSRLHESGDLEKIDEDTAIKVFEMTENYLFRRSVCDMQTKPLESVFLNMDSDIMSFDLTTERYAEKYAYVLFRFGDKGKELNPRKETFPNDDVFFNMFQEGDMYLLRGACDYALERLEDNGIGEKESRFDDIYDKLDIGNRKEGYSVEHIMPQTLTDGWSRDLGDRHEEIHKTWLHRIANLTLTGYNSELKNYTFEQKKEIYRSSGLKITEKLCGYDAWGEEQLNKRNAEFLECAKKIWKLPETGFRPVSEDTFARTCGETEPKRFDRLCLFRYRLRGEKPADGGWDEMFEGVVKTLHGKDSTVLSSILSGTDCNEFPGKHVKSDESSFEHAVKIGDGLYIEKFSRASDMIWLLRDLLRRYGMNPSDLVFLVQDRKSRVRRICGTVERELEELRREGAVRFDSGESSTGYTRFTTDFLDGFFPDAGAGESSWREARDKHWFYEVVTDSGTELYIKLTVNLKNAGREFVDFCGDLNKLCRHEDLSYGKVWCILHETEHIPIGEGFTDDDVREGLEKCLKEIVDNKPELERKKRSLTGAVAGDAGD